jgi:LCP family protein required for cell wall assembly
MSAGGDGDRRRTERDQLHRRARYYRVGARRARWLGPLLWAAWLLLGAGAAVAYGTWALLDETIEDVSPDTARVKQARQVIDPVLPGAPQNILLIGSDSRGRSAGDPGRSDSIILVRVDEQQGFISMLSFPRDSFVSIPGAGQDRINAAYSIGGPAKVIETVKALTGQPVQGYVNVDFKGFANLVDDIGGVYLDVDRRYFNDNSGPGDDYEAIDLAAGYQRLFGDDALDYVRYRHTDSDFARIARQQAFLTEVKRRTKSLGNFTQGPAFLSLLRGNIETDIRSPRRLLDLIQASLSTPDERVFRVSVPGGLGMTAAGASIVTIDPATLQQKVQEWLNPDFLSASAPKIDPAAVRVRVLNGSGRTLIGEDMAGLLRGRGYRALAGGNADSFGYTTTTVLYDPGRAKSIAAGRALKAAIGPQTGLSPLRRGQAGGGDAVVVVGTDFTGALYRAPKTSTKPAPPDTVATAALVPAFRDIQRRTGLRLAVPLKVARGSSVKQVRVYRVNTGGRGPWAAKVVFSRQTGGLPEYWGVQMVDSRLADVAILDGETGTLPKRSGLAPLKTYYNGKFLTREAFEYNGVTYWISNALDKDDSLTAETMHEIARSFRPVATARLPRGATDPGMSVEFDAATP